MGRGRGGPGRASTRARGQSSPAHTTEGDYAMRQLVYVMRFTGRATPASPDGMVLKAARIAPSSSVTSTVGPAGLAGGLHPVAGGEATFESEVTFTGATSFQEVGTIAFGAGHRLCFSTVGSGYLGPS